MTRLRPLAEADLAQLHAWYQDPDLWTHLVGDFRPREAGEAMAYMRRWLAPSPGEVRRAVEADGRLVGLVTLSGIAEGVAEFHIFLGEPADRGRGVGQAATEAMLRLGFHELGLRLVRLEVLASNDRARRLYERLGFESSGEDPARGVVAMTLDAPR